jgi:hypothetical protein
LGSLKRSLPDAELPLVANPGGIRDHAVQVAGLGMAEGGGDENASANTPTVFILHQQFVGKLAGRE